MMYVLTQAEMDNLVPKDTLASAREALEQSRLLLLKVSGFECIHDSSDHYALCDGCPCQRIDGPAEHVNYVSMNQICSKPKEYSQ